MVDSFEEISSMFFHPSLWDPRIALTPQSLMFLELVEATNVTNEIDKKGKDAR